MRLTRYNWCDRCDERVELVPMAGGKAMTRGNHDVSDAIREIEQVEDKLAKLVRESERSAEGSSETPVIQTEKINELREELTESRADVVEALIVVFVDE